jgi:hypothetical protein
VVTTLATVAAATVAVMVNAAMTTRWSRAIASSEGVGRFSDRP